MLYLKRLSRYRAYTVPTMYFDFETSNPICQDIKRKAF